MKKLMMMKMIIIIIMNTVFAVNTAPPQLKRHPAQEHNFSSLNLAPRIFLNYLSDRFAATRVLQSALLTLDAGSCVKVLITTHTQTHW